jgi:hypothetical protein
MRLSRRPFTILELLISLALTSVILSTLTYFYHQMTMAGIVMDRLQGENFKERYVEHRLGAVLPRAIAYKNGNGFHFFTSRNTEGILMPGSQSLIFVFDNCVQANKEMAYLVIGRISLDAEGNLLLVTWPPEKRWKENEPISSSYEVLMEGVSKLEFSFFVPPLKGKTDLKTGNARTVTEPDPLETNRGRWEPEWNPEWRQLPAMVRVIATIREEDSRGEFKDKELIFAFPFPHSPQPITYDG